MIKKLEAQAAHDLIREYEEQVNKQLYKPKKCICCKKDIELLDDDCYPKWNKQDNSYYNDATVVEVNCAYGSSLDTDQFYLAICDHCIKQGVEQGLIENRKHLRNKLQK